MNQSSEQTKRTAKRDQIVGAAFDLFNRNGFYATGVDRIMRNAEVSKRTLYKYFPTKNELIVAVVDHYHGQYKRQMTELLEQTPKSAREKIALIFDSAKEWFENNSFHGCLAVNAMGEFSGKDQMIEDSCRDFKRWELALIEALARETGARKPDQLAFQLFVLLEGMSAVAQVTKAPCPTDITELAMQLVDQYTDSLG